MGLLSLPNLSEKKEENGKRVEKSHLFEEKRAAKANTTKEIRFFEKEVNSPCHKSEHDRVVLEVAMVNEIETWL